MDNQAMEWWRRCVALIPPEWTKVLVRLRFSLTGLGNGFTARAEPSYLQWCATVFIVTDFDRINHIAYNSILPGIVQNQLTGWLRSEWIFCHYQLNRSFVLSTSCISLPSACQQVGEGACLAVLRPVWAFRLCLALTGKCQVWINMVSILLAKEIIGSQRAFGESIDVETAV